MKQKKGGGAVKYVEKNPMIMIVIGVLGISVSAIFVRYSEAPSAVTAALRLLWTVVLMTPVVLGKKTVRSQFWQADRKSVGISILSGLFLAVHFVLWFESLNHTSVASSTSLVCTEVIWVSLGYCLFMNGRLSLRAIGAIGAALLGSVLIALSDSGGENASLYGDLLSVLSAVAVAVYVLIGRVAQKQLSTTVYTYLVYAACAVALTILCALQGYGLFSYGLGAILVGLGLAVCSTIMGHSIFSWCLKYFSPAFVSASKLCEPVVASILAVFLFQEVPAPLQIIGGLLTVGSVLYYSRIEKQ